MTTGRTYDAVITNLANSVYFIHLADQGRALEGVPDKAFLCITRCRPSIFHNCMIKDRLMSLISCRRQMTQPQSCFAAAWPTAAIESKFYYIEQNPGEAGEMKKTLLCDTLSTITMVHQLKYILNDIRLPSGEYRSEQGRHCKVFSTSLLDLLGFQT